MSLNKKSGFTLVELIIVIVVIAILAAISVVAYNGVQDRARTTSGHQLASDVAKKAEFYNTLVGQYSPDRSGLVNGPEESRPDDTSAIINLNAQDPATSTTRHFDKSDAADGTAVAYRACPGGSFSIPRTGGVIYYWDYTNDVRAEVDFGKGCDLGFGTN